MMFASWKESKYPLPKKMINSWWPTTIFFVHMINLFMPIGPQSMNIITLGFANLNENPINEPNKL